MAYSDVDPQYRSLTPYLSAVMAEEQTMVNWKKFTKPEQEYALKFHETVKQVFPNSRVFLNAEPTRMNIKVEAPFKVDRESAAADSLRDYCKRKGYKTATLQSKAFKIYFHQKNKG